MLMEHKGYEVKQGKYISFKPFSREHFSKGYKLGNEYSFTNIRNRIAGKNLTFDFKDFENHMQKKRDFKPYPKVKPGSFKALCIHYMYLLGQVKKNHAPDREINVLKGDLIKFEKMTKTFNFVHDRNLETIEQVLDYKDKCYKKIDELKIIKSELQTEKEEYNPAFDALRKIKLLEKPHQLYLNGYHEMQEEHDSYIITQNKIDSLGYETPNQIEDLEKIKSNLEDKLFANDYKIRGLRKDIRSCKTALELNSHIEKKMHGLKALYRENDNKELSAKEMARNLNER